MLTVQDLPYLFNHLLADLSWKNNYMCSYNLKLEYSAPIRWSRTKTP